MPPPPYPAFTYDVDGPLNLEQQRAVHLVVDSTHPVVLLWGPPGIGKTSTVAAAITSYLVQCPSSTILAIAPSNSAADAIALALLLEFPGAGLPTISLVRLYANSYSGKKEPGIEEACISMTINALLGFPMEIDLPDEAAMLSTTPVSVEEKSVIVCMVNAAIIRAQALSYHPEQFDLVVLDEAGRCGIAESIVSMMRGRRVMLSGDPLQMGPFFQVELKALDQRFCWSFSVLQYLIKAAEERNETAWSVILQQNHRSVQLVLDPSNKQLYKRYPLTAHLDFDLRQRYRDLASRHLFLNNYFPTGPGLAVSVCYGDNIKPFNLTSCANLVELHTIASFIQEFYNSRLHLECTVGIVTTTMTTQRRLVQELIHQKRKSGELTLVETWLTVGSAEFWQGRQCDFALLTSCYGDPFTTYRLGPEPHNLGFTGQAFRINVAVPRCRFGALLCIRPAKYVRNRFWRELLMQVAQKQNLCLGAGKPIPSTELELLRQEFDQKNTVVHQRMSRTKRPSQTT